MTKRGSLLMSALLFSGCALPVPVFTQRASAMQVIDDDDSQPVFTDWWYHMHVALRDSDGEYLWPQNPTPTEQLLGVPAFSPGSEYFYSPMPQPSGSHGIGFSGWMSWLLVAAMNEVALSGSPVTILLRERNSPFPYHTNGNTVDPGALAAALDALPRLDYLYADLEFEPESIERNIREIVRIVRAHPNPEIANAFIGNYDDYPGALDKAGVWDSRQDRGGGGVYHGFTGWDRDTFYRTSGLNIAMPVAYHYEFYSVHANRGLLRGDPASPSTRSASLWAPIEHVSTAARELDPSHKLIPWISPHISYQLDDPNNYYYASPPPRTDLSALVMHLYLRGADGFSVWTKDPVQTDHPLVNRQQYLQLALDAWEEIESTLNGEPILEVLNLSTNKADGIEWSGVRSQSHVAVLVSNLSGNPRARGILLPSIEGLPVQTAAISNGTHRIFVYDLPIAEEAASTQDDGNSSQGTDNGDSDQSYTIATNSFEIGGGGGGGGGGGSGGGGGGGGSSVSTGGSTSSTSGGDTNIVRITRSSGSSSSTVAKTTGQSTSQSDDSE